MGHAPASRAGGLLFGPPTGRQQLASLWQETADDEENVETNPRRCAPVVLVLKGGAAEMLRPEPIFAA